jgi:two-component system, response regulator YesN
MKIFESKYRNQLIGACIIFGTIPTIIVGCFASYTSIKSIKENVNASNASTVTQAKMSIEQQMIEVDATIYQFLESTSLNDVRKIELTGSNFEAISKIDRQMASLPLTQLSIRNIGLANIDMNWIISTDGSKKLSDYESTDNSISFFNVSNKLSVWYDPFTSKKRITNYKDCLTFVKRSPDNTNPFAVIVNVPFQSIYNLISHNSSLGSVMIITPSGCIIENDNMSKCGIDIKSTGLFKKLEFQKADEGTFEVNYQNALCAVNYVRSDYNGWYYINIYSVSKITQREAFIGWFTILVCLIIIALIFLLSLPISGIFYKPIGRICKELMAENHRHDENIVRKDELQLIEQNVNLLLTDHNKLKTQIYKQINMVKEYFTVNLLTEKVNPNVICHKIDMYGYPKEPGLMVVLAASINTLKDTEYDENDIDLLLYAVKNIVGELLEQFIVTVPVIIHEYQITIISVNEGSKESVYKWLMELKRVILQAIGINISIGVSKAISCYEDIRKGYNQSVEALQYKVLLGQNAVIFLDDIQNNKKMRPVYPIDCEKEILRAVAACDMAESSEMLHQFMDNIFNIKSNRQEYKVFLQRLLIDLLILQKQKVEEENNQNSSSYLEKMLNFSCREEIEAWLRDEFIASVIKSIKNSEKNNFGKICNDTIDFIHKKYDSKITLEECASQLNYHPSYIRRVLKKEMGINFSEYLVQYRINIAKKWLTETDMRVSDIAEKLTYENCENFIRSFKKITGMTPKQFRDNKDDMFN